MMRKKCGFICICLAAMFAGQLCQESASAAAERKRGLETASATAERRFAVRVAVSKLRFPSAAQQMPSPSASL